MAKNTKKSFNLRAFASVFAGLSFVLMVVTGLALFIAPSCRIASDTSWTVWGHDKDQWVAVHVWLSIAFIIASAIHIYLNWSVLISYFKSKIRKGWAFRAEWLAALAVCAVLYAGSAREVAGRRLTQGPSCRPTSTKSRRPGRICPCRRAAGPHRTAPNLRARSGSSRRRDGTKDAKSILQRRRN